MSKQKIHKVKDNTSKLILENPELFAQFLNDFVPIDLLKGLKSEDIEDVKERFLPLTQENRDADTVKCIHLKGDTPIFVIAIVEHQSTVDYNASFRMLRYIVMVLDRYEAELQNGELTKHSSHRNFRYPPVLPILFYDGPGKWTAEQDFRERTYLNDVFGPYIPSFKYELVDLNRYSMDDILQFNDALSMVMMVDKLKSVKEVDRLPSEYFKKISLKIPSGLAKLLQKAVIALLYRLDVAEGRIEELAEEIAPKEERVMFEGVVNIINKELRANRRLQRQCEQLKRERAKDRAEAQK
ncbi:MAG: Rpn family recombination-promoting nuclease/putative transposase, partial [Treponema sp.]|nr:Rpn family recombination-promoting nuclease/putative transposase [Treponema sp.]